MFLHDVINDGPLPALELTMRFAGQRQAILAHNIANLTTPDFRPRDVDGKAFQRVLGEAIDERRESGRPGKGLEWNETRELTRSESGHLRVSPRTPSGNVLFHDRNDRDVERTMQALVENAGVFRVASELYRSHTGRISRALGERVA